MRENGREKEGGREREREIDRERGREGASNRRLWINLG